ncbi:MAG: N-succinylarginine dihydrolase [Puniceicoccaceae bacterium]
MRYREVNFDGLVGPTHNYAGLSLGNVASQENKDAVSNPRKAALQGLEKAKALADRGFPQAILPPQERPAIGALLDWGIKGTSDADVLSNAATQAPQLLAASASASSMWTANACTMTPSIDSGDERTHFTPANLSSKLHRSIEAPFTCRLLKAIFADEDRFVVHPPLGGGVAMADEGAANHTRFCPGLSSKGLHLFVYGRHAFTHLATEPKRYPARQTRESFESIARHHEIPDEQQIFLQQSPEAIDAGVFHNDVISVGNRDVFLCHEDAFLDQEAAIRDLQAAFQALSGDPLRLIQVPREQVSLQDAVGSYLFNSQLLTLGEGCQLLVAPSESSANSQVAGFLQHCLEDKDNPIEEVLYFDLRESMRNGGGPACLRQRVVLNAGELRHLKGRVLLDDSLYTELKDWIETHYREKLAPADLADPQLLEESRRALDALTGILHLPSLYDFQGAKNP